MSTADRAEATARAAYEWASHRMPDAGAQVALHLGDQVSAQAWGTGPQPGQVSALAIGLRALAERHFPADRLNALAIEAAIAEVEDVVMPWHGKLPPAARLAATTSILENVS